MSTFQILLCTNQEPVIVESGEETLTPGTTWSFSAETGILICGTVVEPVVGIANYRATTEYDGCVECLEDIIPPITANTVYNVCVTCSGTTYTVETEHPVWTGLYGETIIQANAVQLGGRNGLYS